MLLAALLPAAWRCAAAAAIGGAALLLLLASSAAAAAVCVQVLVIDAALDGVTQGLKGLRQYIQDSTGECL